LSYIFLGTTLALSGCSTKTYDKKTDIRTITVPFTCNVEDYSSCIDNLCEKAEICGEEAINLCDDYFMGQCLKNAGKNILEKYEIKENKSFEPIKNEF